VLGVAEFDRSGRATVPAGKRSVTVKGVPLADTSVILAVAQASENRYVVAAVPDVFAPHLKGGSSSGDVAGTSRRRRAGRVPA
jgi:hypothetical protein